ncbi:hypothetical protein [Aquabacterium sp.]|uniref:hypothetical protein n=1 Tax=Aquabacterium sp. TaxID=1872578 RepID=UPI002D1AD30F|nr:hypothetical protein [Aquabacterium sp.]HSW08855.1 hypothetical protein [Aquabacterium sp.]
MTRFQRAALVGAAAMILAALVDLFMRGSWLRVMLGMGLAVGVLMLPRLALTLGSVLKDRFRQHLWSDEEGRYHNFGGISLRIEHDAHHSWIAGSDLQRVLGTHDRDDVLAARLAGHWRRDEQSVLMLRVDGVVAHLAGMPGRMDPRIVRLRRYFEREVLFPAAQRRLRR